MHSLIAVDVEEVALYTKVQFNRIIRQTTLTMNKIIRHGQQIGQYDMSQLIKVKTVNPTKSWKLTVSTVQSCGD